MLLRRNLEAIGAGNGANLQLFSFGGSFRPLHWSPLVNPKYREETVYIKTHKMAINPIWITQERRNTHFKYGKLFFVEIVSFSQVTETIGFFSIQILIF